MLVWLIFFVVFPHHQEDPDIGFPASLSCSLVLSLLLGGLQALVLPRTTILLLLFLTAFIWIAVILMLLLAVRLRCILWDLSRSFLLRLAITIFSIILIYTMAQVNVVSGLFGQNSLATSGNGMERRNLKSVFEVGAGDLVIVGLLTDTPLYWCCILFLYIYFMIYSRYKTGQNIWKHLKRF